MPVTPAAATEGHLLYGDPIARRSYPEIAVGGFSRVDGMIAFYTQIAALLQPHHHVLDFGAGRGEPTLDDPVPYRRALVTLRGRAAHVAGCDVSAAVLSNPFLDSAAVITPGQPFPYEDGRFDLVVSRYVFEHVPDPGHTAAELIRVTRPGGWICAVTANSWGYVALAARLVANRHHAASLSRIQPGRKAEDVFPTHYRLNTPGALRRHFGHACDIHGFRASAEPAYYFGNASLFAAFRLLHRLLPEFLQTGLTVFMRKRP